MLALHALLAAASLSFAQTACPASTAYTTTQPRMTKAVCDAAYKDRLALLAPLQKQSDDQEAAELQKQGCPVKEAGDCKVVSRNRRDSCHHTESPQCMKLRNKLDEESPAKTCQNAEDARYQACLKAVSAYETKEADILKEEKAAEDDYQKRHAVCTLWPWPPIRQLGQANYGDNGAPVTAANCKQALDEATAFARKTTLNAMAVSTNYAHQLDHMGCPRTAPADAAGAMERPNCAEVRVMRFQAECDITFLDRCKPLLQASDDACTAQAAGDLQALTCKQLQAAYSSEKKLADGSCVTIANPNPAIAIANAATCAKYESDAKKLRGRLKAKGCSVP